MKKDNFNNNVNKNYNNFEKNVQENKEPEYMYYSRVLKEPFSEDEI